VSEKNKVLLDTHFRRIEEIFSPEDRERLYGLADIVWGKNEPIPIVWGKNEPIPTYAAGKRVIEGRQISSEMVFRYGVV